MRRRSVFGEMAKQRFEFVAQVLDLAAAIRRDRQPTRFADGEHAARMAGAVCCMTVAARHFLETLARPADREALLVEQAANPAHHLSVVLLVVTAIAAPLHRLELREFLFPVAQYVRLDLDQIADFAHCEVTNSEERRGGKEW